MSTSYRVIVIEPGAAVRLAEGEVAVQERLEYDRPAAVVLARSGPPARPEPSPTDAALLVAMDRAFALLESILIPGKLGEIRPFPHAVDGYDPGDES